VPGDLSVVLKLKQDLDDAPDAVDIYKYDNNCVAEVLKKFFADLPEPLVPFLIDQHVKALFSIIVFKLAFGYLILFSGRKKDSR